jgi:hypothetical protein
MVGLSEGISGCHQAALREKLHRIPDAKLMFPSGMHMLHAGFFHSPWIFLLESRVRNGLEKIQLSILTANLIFVLITNEILLTLNEMPQGNEQGLF